MSPKKLSSRKSGHKRGQLHKKFPQIRGGGDRTSRLNSVLVDLRKKTEKQLNYWRAFQNYLVDEREKRQERIRAALQEQAIAGYENESLVRIVDSRYQTRPLSSYGSVVVPPGGRFNFGDISAHYVRFQALYLASDFRTAASERFLRDQTLEDEVDQASLDLRLDPDASFSAYRVRVSNLSVIDTRNPECLKPFVDVIAEIDPPDWIEELAKKFRQPEPSTVKTVDAFRSLIFDPNFTQWGSLIDQPSASQWFGYYVREAGIHGIIYPSVRRPSGFNLAIFPDTIAGTSAKVELVDPAGGVKIEDRVMDGENAQFHMAPSRPEDSEVRH